MITSMLVKELGVKKGQVENAIKLIDEGNTIPFIARYRKEMTGGLSDEILRQLHERLTYLRNLEDRKQEVIRIIDEQGKLTAELEKAINKADMLQKVEDLYRPYKQKKSTRAEKARERGLEPLAQAIIEGKRGILEFAASFIDAEKEVDSEEAAIAGAKDIIAEGVSDNAAYRQWIRELCLKTAVLNSQATDKDSDSVYSNYYDFSEPISKAADHRILAINRGESEKFLRVKLLFPDERMVEYLKSKEIKSANECTSYMEEAIEDAYKRLIQPSIERELRSGLTERAQENAIALFGKNLKGLIMASPVKDVRVLAIDPSFRTGCKLSVLDETGKLLEYSTIYPNAPRNETEKSKQEMLRLIEKHEVDIISIGNGTASRETESFVAESIKDLSRAVHYTIVSEAGASVYSASKLANEEYPDIDVSIRGAISIGRRLQDPMAELVKIDPKSIGVGQYQHDLNQKRLDEALKGVVEDCVNSVGVDINTATVSLLRYVSGISESIAKNIVAYRDENGKFNGRQELKKVKRLGDKAFEQCAGFLRIHGGANLLDNTAVHPESYEAAKRLLEILGIDISGASKVSIDRKDIDIKALCEQTGIGELTLADIITELLKPGRDPRDEMPKPILRSDVLSIEDLKVGMVLSGTVRNVVDFGAFVDIGIKNDGLVHISQICERFIKHPMEVLSVGDIINVRIIDVNHEKGKVSLSMKEI
ncbi:MAG: S1 RNA-binding domain-containing protein [Peptoclostridium sp.]|uniref:Tex family protein n=1 Tax=Peptoclostridium sp. TaxID=1904860 RepID=UPI00139B0BFD|nr:Tex family protein [Peptoclostridium sp.]MZQ75199.1 S1 RNA-binding domain-containing protein [Peptoclostridium sp.]